MNSTLLNVSNEHAIWNNSDIPRIHMISHSTIPRANYNRFILENLHRLIDK
jgi:hypothetical protein